MKRLKRKNYLEKIPEGAKLVSRPSRWGNPNSLKDIPDIEQNLDVYEAKQVYRGLNHYRNNTERVLESCKRSLEEIRF